MIRTAIGGGGQYVRNRVAQSGPQTNGFLLIVPGYWTMDLIARCRINDCVTANANLKNLDGNNRTRGRDRPPKSRPILDLRMAGNLVAALRLRRCKLSAPWATSRPPMMQWPSG